MNPPTDSKPRSALSPNETLALILIPMVIIVVGLRLYLHLVGINHLYVFGYIVRHLFSGVMIVIPAAFVLAFVPSRRSVAQAFTIALGVGSGLVLDEIVFLIATSATKEDYVSPMSVWGSIVFLSIGAVLLLTIFIIKRRF
jgi:hypothetical protein